MLGLGVGDLDLVGQRWSREMMGDKCGTHVACLHSKVLTTKNKGSD